MQTQLKKWGNSLALRIPSYLAKELKVTDDAVVEINREGNKLVIEPLTKDKKYNLEELLAKVTKTNLHKETKIGQAVGDEVW